MTFRLGSVAVVGASSHSQFVETGAANLIDVHQTEADSTVINDHG